jgi:hypothetical protein
MHDASQPPEKATMDPSIPQRRNHLIFKLEVPTSLHPIHSGELAARVDPALDDHTGVQGMWWGSDGHTVWFDLLEVVRGWGGWFQLVELVELD